MARQIKKNFPSISYIEEEVKLHRLKTLGSSKSGDEKFARALWSDYVGKTGDFSTDLLEKFRFSYNQSLTVFISRRIFTRLYQYNRTEYATGKLLI